MSNAQPPPQADPGKGGGPGIHNAAEAAKRTHAFGKGIGQAGAEDIRAGVPPHIVAAAMARAVRNARAGGESPASPGQPSSPVRGGQIARAGQVARIIQQSPVGQPKAKGHSPREVVGQAARLSPTIQASGTPGVNRPIVIAVVVIAGVGLLHAHLKGEKATPILTGAILLLIFLSILDLFGGPLSTIASMIAYLTLISVLLLDLPTIIPALQTTQNAAIGGHAPTHQ